MNAIHAASVSLLVTLLVPPPALAQWGAPQSPVIPGASGYIAIPHAVVTPQPTHLYRAIFDATRAAEKPDQLLPALDMAGSELNVLGSTGVPLKNAKFAIVFHGGAMAGILDDAHYRAKYGVANPNLAVLADMRKAGVELFVCGQNLAFENVPPGAVCPDVRIATDALIVLMEYQRMGYSLLSF